MNTNYVNVANTITNAPGTESFFNVTTGSDAYIEVLKDGWYRVGMIASYLVKMLQVVVLVMQDIQ